MPADNGAPSSRTSVRNRSRSAARKPERGSRAVITCQPTSSLAERPLRIPTRLCSAFRRLRREQQAPPHELPLPPRPSDGRGLHSCQTAKQAGILADDPSGHRGGLLRFNSLSHRCQYNRTAFMERDRDLIAHVEAREIHERGIKHNAMRITNLADRFRHEVKLCITHGSGKRFKHPTGMTMKS